MPSASSVTPLARFDDLRLDPERGLALEWLETDGLGGYASSTALACATRRYHGLLVGRPAGRAERFVFLARFDERVLVDGRETAALSMARYGATTAPEGWRALERFELAPWPRWSYAVGGARLVRELFLVRGSRTVLVRYRLEGEPPEATGLGGALLVLRPLVPMRPADALGAEDAAPWAEMRADGGRLAVRRSDDLPTLSLTAGHPEARFELDPTWYRGATYATDEARGYGGRDDQLSPGLLRLPLDGDTVVAATLGEPVADPAALWRREARRRRGEAEALVAASGPLVGRLRLGARDFLYRDGAGRHGVTAGFPWFGEWGRDTFLSLPGLTLAQGDLEGCARVLSDALPFLRDGLLPNVFGTSPEDSAYNSADASLWFARAVRAWEEAGGDQARLLDEFLPALREVGEAYHDGAPLGIGADEDCLLGVGAPEHNPTWMDARVDGVPVTPRDGFPVEINALWYALLAHMEELCGRSGDAAGARLWAGRRRKARRAFLRRFWIADGAYLADRWKDGEADRSVRPNMVIAAALAASPLSRKERAGVVERAERELLCEHGLRTLSPSAPGYQGRYRGGPAERDRAYHQGTVWPWLLGFWAEAKLRATGKEKAVLGELHERLEAFRPELDRDGLGHVSEVFDGDQPRGGGGTIAQAWNTAELLRLAAMVERGRP